MRRRWKKKNKEKKLVENQKKKQKNQKKGKETMKSLPMQNLSYPQTHVKKDKEDNMQYFWMSSNDCK